jgi:hypothetical protein
LPYLAGATPWLLLGVAQLSPPPPPTLFGFDLGAGGFGLRVPGAAVGSMALVVVLSAFGFASHELWRWVRASGPHKKGAWESQKKAGPIKRGRGSRFHKEDLRYSIY